MGTYPSQVPDTEQVKKMILANPIFLKQTDWIFSAKVKTHAGRRWPVLVEEYLSVETKKNCAAVPYDIGGLEVGSLNPPQTTSMLSPTWVLSFLQHESKCLRVHASTMQEKGKRKKRDIFAGRWDSLATYQTLCAQTCGGSTVQRKGSPRHWYSLTWGPTPPSQLRIQWNMDGQNPVTGEETHAGSSNMFVAIGAGNS